MRKYDIGDFTMEKILVKKRILNEENNFLEIDRYLRHQQINCKAQWKENLMKKMNKTEYQKKIRQKNPGIKPYSGIDACSFFSPGVVWRVIFK